MDFTNLLATVIGGLAGFWVKSLFDTRDLRRIMLKEPFESFEKTIHDMRDTWRQIQRINTFNNDLKSYAEHYNKSIKELNENYSLILSACDKIREQKLKTKLEKAYKESLSAIEQYDNFFDIGQFR